MSSQIPSLTQSIEAMSLQQPPNPTKATNTASQDQIHLPVPYRTPAAKDHRILYGFAVSTEWLVSYCEQNAHRINGYGLDPVSLGTKTYLAMKLLRASSRLRNLTIEGVICNARDPSLELERSPGRCVPIVCVCSSMRSSYERRPTQAQMDKLRRIIQQEPDWYVDVNPPSYYSGSSFAGVIVLSLRSVCLHRCIKALVSEGAWFTRNSGEGKISRRGGRSFQGWWTTFPSSRILFPFSKVLQRSSQCEYHFSSTASSNLRLMQDGRRAGRGRLVNSRSRGSRLEKARLSRRGYVRDARSRSHSLGREEEKAELVAGGAGSR
ncbi:hypothetical protein FPV67DRAFT_1750519 [Lyophyllum atratum]|nr:hypothetical protein FPV67DRAFT_1750519 [Lyophyllum atratum]